MQPMNIAFQWNPRLTGNTCQSNLDAIDLQHALDSSSRGPKGKISMQCETEWPLHSPWSHVRIFLSWASSFP